MGREFFGYIFWCKVFFYCFDDIDSCSVYFLGLFD